MKLQMQQTREHPLRRTYERAINVSQMKLTPTHPLRLRAALNYSVLSYELLKEQEKAVALAKKAFDDAISKLDQLDEASYKDSTAIMQSMREKLHAWTGGQNEEPED
jgi:hypothetical protein